ncbi:MAG: hypothetical protein MJ245_00230 [Clostridia bacterium]|nr:hypothetical protein [Clostridia bacterium]
MELKLNIYNKKEIVKTYTAETYDLMFGTVEDLIGLIDLDTIQTGSDNELFKLILDVVIKGFDVIKPLIKDIFDGVTDEELRNVHTADIASVLVEVVKFTIVQATKGGNGKN